jgi:hypothetical protein
MHYNEMNPAHSQTERSQKEGGGKKRGEEQEEG